MVSALCNLQSILQCRFIILCVLVGCLPAVVVADRKADAGTDGGNRLHGPLEFLNQSLEISTENNRLLGAASRELQEGNGDSGFQALLYIFARPDGFVPAVDGVSPGSSYQQALDLLAGKDANTRAAWVDAVEPLARQALQAATDSDALALVARKFPLTPSGIKARISSAYLARSRGQHHLAEAILREVESMSLNGVEPSQDPLRTRLRETGSSSESRPISGSQIAGQPIRKLPTQLSLPWPDPKWQWTERLWDHSESTVFSQLLDPAARSSLTLNSWHPTLFGNTIYMKTPFHVVAFDKSSGSIQWSLTTDSLKQNGRDGDSDAGANATSVNLADVLRRDSMGTVAVSDSFVFFVDHFRIFESRLGNFQFGNLGQRPRNSRIRLQASVRNGSRLVAVRHSPKPSIAWAIGDSPEFDYELSIGELSSLTTASSQQQDVASEDDETKTVEFDSPPTGDFAGQHFCGVPVIHDQMLFVITQDRETYWLNCLTESTGRLLWKKMLAHINDGGDRPGQFLMSSETDRGASLCGVAGDVVVCALHNGIVLGTRITDGQFLWASNLRDETDSVTQAQLRNLLAIAVNVPSGIRSQPVIRGDRLYWAAPFSTDVHCLSTTTGNVNWQVSRSTDGSGRLEGSTDRYVAGITDSAAIIIGTRHVRALSLEDGSELWVTPIRDQTGRAFCNESSCLIPLVDGSLIQLDVADGSRHTLSESLASNGPSSVGAVVADDDVICLATPLSVSVADTSQVVLKDQKRPALHQATANILAGNIDQGLASLEQVSVGQPNTEASNKSTNILVESLLNLHNLAEGELSLSPESIAERLGDLPMTAEQKIRRAILFGAPINDFSGINFGDRLPELKLDFDWTARADVAAWNHLSFGDAQHVADFNDDQRSVPSRLEHAILYPEHVGNLDQKMVFVRQLLEDHRDAAAELFLLSARNTASDSDALKIDNEIKRLRAHFAQTLKVGPRTEISTVKFTETSGLAAVSAISQLPDRITMHVGSPQWYSERLFVSGRSLISANFNYGVETSELRLPGSPNDIVETPDAFETPSIIPIAGINWLGVVSLLNPDGPRILWWRKFESSEFEVAPIMLGPFGSSFLMVSVGTEFVCLHPLTGKELWRRQTSDDIPRQGLLDRFPRLVGNSSVMARPGQRMKSYELFRTQDGRMLGTFGIDIPDGQTPLSSGHSILYLNNQTLALRQLWNQQDLLADRPEIKIAGAGHAVLLRNHRAITLTDDLDLVVLNLLSGDIETRCPIGAVMDRESIIGIKAFERNDSLYVVLKDWNSSRSDRTASSRMGETKLESGLLCRIDPNSGQLLWHRKIESCVAPIIYGAETNLLVTWSWQNPVSLLEEQLGGRRSGPRINEVLRTMVVTAINIDTGETIAEGRHLNPAEPLRCVHNDGQKVIILESDTSAIELNYD